MGYYSDQNERGNKLAEAMDEFDAATQALHVAQMERGKWEHAIKSMLLQPGFEHCLSINWNQLRRTFDANGLKPGRKHRTPR